MPPEGDRSRKKVLVVGLGVSGRSVSELLLRQGHEVIATDLRSREQIGRELDLLERQGCSFRLSSHRQEDFLSADQIIVSPGVPLDLPFLREAAARGIEITGELDWAWSQVAVPVVAVTGTNGKTTTTSLIGEILKNAGRKVFVGGNIGTPLSQWILSNQKADMLVLEVSSFQLDSASHFRPEIGVLLNVTEDHLDRYSDFAAYIDSKFSLFSRQDGAHTAIVNGDDALCRQRMCQIQSRTLFFSRSDPLAHAAVRAGKALIKIPGIEPFALNLERAGLKGVHNEENILAAALVGAVLGISPKSMEESIEQCSSMPHRLEWVGNWHGVDFYDDSKATNVGAVLKALESFDRGVLLLLGGRDKLGSYEELGRSLKARGKGAMVYGEAAPRLYGELKRWIPIWSFLDLSEAFTQAVRVAEPGDTVLLSPACSSFDQYTSYAQRGDHFKRLVMQLLAAEQQRTPRQGCLEPGC
ncbi:UDP-N-acetylmuramoyl-L-alanine--D-glutamate ligase [Desulfoferrobacter suflitae]|uniref:UDP-N-acetylmuramoyl-L-alanine--D-glutamate ligase n=1 Tax=Desulfoferrobacter suflitae TaxID=2865782 RepID=UPI0021647BC7|nr:UDP-N-acetylmuramoyl-L-alanine--D-glutamate ligase [Desulfoferrobacter suflitae]MCK8600409.1 UDP-N-acetylmuramoyl-L-alanine--D-glutamate ligase [Desulfoferrobacter suflitae]